MKLELIISFIIVNLLYVASNAATNDDDLGFELCDKIGNNLLKPYCLNNGVCYKTRAKKKVLTHEDMFCSCPAEYSGPRCEILKKKKEEITFNSNDEIVPTPETHFIKCPDWYNCLNNGTCVVDLVVGPKCICTEQFEGLNCGKAKFCPNMNECTRRCDFGYKRKHGCDVCECKCVNEFNFYTEMKYELINNTQNMTTKFCNKICPYGYVKDDYDCYKCSCIKEKDVSDKQLITNEGYVTINKGRDRSCPNDFCSDGEICRYFNSSLFKCPDNQFDCRLYDGQEYIPMCYPPNLSELCLEPLIAGDCTESIGRYYFDLTEKTCKKFDYSGCGANRNHFESLHDCSKQCGQVFTDYVVDDEIEEEGDDGEGEYDGENSDSSEVENTETSNQEIESTDVEDVTTTTAALTSDYLTTTTTTDSDVVYDVTETTNFEVEDTTTEAFTEPISQKGGSNCDWICGISCPFGYKMDLKTKCYKCECVELNMTRCGVPCYLTGTKTCLFSNRANSRPTCLCNEGFDGVYCQSLTLSFNFSVRIERLALRLNDNLIAQLKINISKQLIDQFEITLKQILINNIRNDFSNGVIVEFSIFGPDFSNLTHFYGIVDMIYNQLNSKKVFINYLSQNVALILNCEKSEELFAMDLEEKYFSSIDKLKQFFSDLKAELSTSYKFKSDSLKSLKIAIEPRLAVEFSLTNFDLDPDFCGKTYILNNDIRLKNFILLTKFDHTLYEISTAGNSENYDWSANFWNENQQSIQTPQNSDSGFLLQSTSWFSNTIIFIIIAVASCVILIAVISALVATSMKRKSARQISRLSEPSTISAIRPDKKSRDFVGYFMPNSHNHRRCKSVLSDDDALTSVSGHKISLIPYFKR